ncbi:NAD(+) diphosphatase [Sphingomonas jatrophae]|uniref:NAD(+) diphosphatase n=1 Tax=Sphingomonas jatrophae TaxID=1166337 RepID=A0A1I6KY33_9SPHN|nr:NAD(+) diphosphatase [Sphingomonas jatrophae]SFR96129.1 NAD+ diphosphatase [Sphingomonas jatrophae]
MTPAGFTGSRLDRADAWRGDPERFAALLADPAARLLRLDGLDPLLEADGTLGWAPLPADPTPLAFLGMLDGAPRFAALGAVPPATRRTRGLEAALALMPPAEAATYAAARSLIDWHARHGFCANCSAVTAAIRAGWARSCPDCGAEHYPRTDPVVIMLAEHGTGDDARVLVGRQASWPPNRYSALAGFVEVGESIEEAVARELFEEAGVRAGDVRFVASQPWPFPSQLMIACIATVDDARLTLDANEIESALWVDRAGIAGALAESEGAPFLAPPPYAIAHTLFERWLAGA